MLTSDQTVGPVNPDVTYMFVKHCINRARWMQESGFASPIQQVVLHLAARVTELEQELAKERESRK